MARGDAVDVELRLGEADVEGLLPSLRTRERELQAEGRLPAAAQPLDQIGPAFRKAAAEDLIESRDPARDETGLVLAHRRPPRERPSFREAMGAPGAPGTPRALKKAWTWRARGIALACMILEEPPGVPERSRARRLGRERDRGEPSSVRASWPGHPDCDGATDSMQIQDPNQAGPRVRTARHDNTAERAWTRASSARPGPAREGPGMAGRGPRAETENVSNAESSVALDPAPWREGWAIGRSSGGWDPTAGVAKRDRSEPGARSQEQAT